MAAELASQFTTPHQFDVMERGRKKHECAFCKHQISRNLEEGVVKCRKCGNVCHAHCRLLMPYNCGQEKQLKRRFSKKVYIFGFTELLFLCVCSMHPLK